MEMGEGGVKGGWVGEGGRGEGGWVGVGGGCPGRALFLGWISPPSSTREQESQL
jgi:hypothetical protein